MLIIGDINELLPSTVDLAREAESHGAKCAGWCPSYPFVPITHEEIEKISTYLGTNTGVSLGEIADRGWPFIAATNVSEKAASSLAFANFRPHGSDPSIWIYKA